MGTLAFVYDGTNKFNKQLDQSLMNFYLIGGGMNAHITKTRKNKELELLHELNAFRYLYVVCSQLCALWPDSDIDHAR